MLRYSIKPTFNNIFKASENQIITKLYRKEDAFDGV
jgi:hypothetical protein